MMGWALGLGLGGGVVLLVSDDDARARRGVEGPDAPRLRRALVVVLYGCGRTERVERVGGRILVMLC